MFAQPSMPILTQSLRSDVIALRMGWVESLSG